MRTLRDTIRRACATHGERVAFVDAESGRALSYTGFERRSNQVANALAAQGVGRGAPLCLLLEGSLAWPVCEAALAKLGAVCVPLNYRLSARELAWQLRHSQSTALLAGGNHLPVARRAAEQADSGIALLAVDPQLAAGAIAEPVVEALADDHSAEHAFGELAGEDPQRLMYTSATTGSPKGVLCPNVHICDNVDTIRANQLADMTADDVYLAATPMTHMAIGYTWPVLALGASTVIARRYDPQRFAGQVERFGVTHTLVAPTMIVMLLAHLRSDPDALASLRSGPLRRMWYAGSSMPPAVADEAERRMGPILAQQYGFTELFSAARSMCATFLPPDEHGRKPGSCGRPMEGLEVRVVDPAGAPVPAGTVGEIVVRTVEPVGGYLGDATRTEETFGGGWVRPGDVGRFDADGYLYITDRTKDMIISGGFNVYSAEVENVIAEHPGVQECAVVAMPDEQWVEVPCAYVVRRSGDVSSQEIVDWVRDRLAHFKAPKLVVFRDELPKSVTGKILKRALRDELRGRGIARAEAGGSTGGG